MFKFIISSPTASTLPSDSNQRYMEYNDYSRSCQIIKGDNLYNHTTLSIDETAAKFYIDKPVKSNNGGNVIFESPIVLFSVIKVHNNGYFLTNNF